MPQAKGFRRLRATPRWLCPLDTRKPFGKKAWPNTNLQSTYRQILGWNKPILRQAPLPGGKPACGRFPWLVLFHLSALPIERLKISIRTRLHKHMRTSFRQILPQTALKILAGRKPACGFLPTLQQNYARKSAHISYEDRFLFFSFLLFSQINAEMHTKN